MPSFKSCLTTLAVMAVAFAPLSAATSRADAIAARGLHNGAKAANDMNVEKRAAAKVAAAKRAAKSRTSAANTYTTGAFAHQALALAAASTRCAATKYCSNVALIANSQAVCVNRKCQLQCLPGYAPGTTDATVTSCVAAANSCVSNGVSQTCPSVASGFNTCSEGDSNGTCVQGCPNSYTLHQDSASGAYACLQLASDPLNCGVAGNVCPQSYNGVGTPRCYSSSCTLTCKKGTSKYAGGSAAQPNLCA